MRIEDLASNLSDAVLVHTQSSSLQVKLTLALTVADCLTPLLRALSNLSMQLEDCCIYKCRSTQVKVYAVRRGG